MQQLVPTMIPGLVFGGLALIAFALFRLWGVYACCTACCRRCRAKQGGRAAGGAEVQHVTREDVLPPAEVRWGLLWQYQLSAQFGGWLACGWHATPELRKPQSLSQLVANTIPSTACPPPCAGTRRAARHQAAGPGLVLFPRPLAPAAAGAGAGGAGRGYLGAGGVHPIHQHDHLNLLVRGVVLRLHGGWCGRLKLTLVLKAAEHPTEPGWCF